MSSQFNPNTITEIQKAMLEYNVDGWLFYDFWKANSFAQKILKMPSHIVQSRRFFYLIPKSGEPKKLLHNIEQFNLDHLPGEKKTYVSWKSGDEGLRWLLQGMKTVAMEYSPMNAIPYVSKVDAGTIERVKNCGVNIVSSADLAQYFDARWNDEQLRDNLEVSKVLRQTVDDTFAFMREKIKAKQRITEYDVQQFMLSIFKKHDYYTEFDPNCSVNANSANPHYEPTKEIHSELHENDFVLIDLWAKKNKPGATYGDITWVGFLGSSVPEKYVKVFNVVAGARDAAFAFVENAFANKKKIRGCDVDDVSRNYIVERGYGEYFVHRTGHSITEDLHGTGAHIDNLETHDERLIIPETSFSIEPGVYLPGDFGIRSEVDVFITKDGNVMVTGEPRQREMIAILK